MRCNQTPSVSVPPRNVTVKAVRVPHPTKMPLNAMLPASAAVWAALTGPHEKAPALPRFVVFL